MASSLSGQVNGRWSLPKKQVLHRVRRSGASEEYFVYVPSSGGHGAPLFVTVHGISLNAHEHATLFSSYCETYGVVMVAPRFSAQQYRDYQRLGRVGLGDRADVALNSIIEEVVLLTGVSATKIHLFGYSGGAQFAHRYTMAHPHRVARLAIASAGWYTFPDDRRRFPYGIRPSRRLPRVSFDPVEFLRVPIAVFIGEHDDSDANPRRSERIDQQQGVTRVERARNWVAAMRATADAYQLDSLVSYQEVVGANHDFEHSMKCSELGESVFKSLFARAAVELTPKIGI